MSQTSEKKFNLGALTRILSYVGPYRARFIFTFIMVLALALLAPVRPKLIQMLVDNGVSAGDSAYVFKIFLWIVVLLLIEAVLTFVQTYTANWVAQSVTLDLRSKLYNKVLRFKLKYFDKTPVGTFVTRLISDIDGIADVFSNGVLTIIGDILKLVVVIGYMFYQDWRLTLIVLIPVPILLFATRIFQRTIKKAFTQVRNQVNKINVFVQEHVTGMNIIQIFNREKREQARFDRLNKDHLKANVKSIWAFAIFFPIVEILSAGSVALLLWWGVKEVGDQRITLGYLLQFILYVFMLYRPIRQLADRFNVLLMGIVNAERVFTILDTNERIADEGTNSHVPFTGQIAFNKVWFAYNDEDWVLKDISFDVKKGETIAFVGATGAGKTSIINLLSRFYEFQRGKISVDGVSVRDIPLDLLRSHVSVVLQDVFLFSDTILENIRLYDERISEEQVIEAAKKVRAHEFISRLPGGYHYNVRERGGMLSVGQRQLLAFIRAYIYNPSILILDEATSSVDTETEELIQHAIEELTKGRTSIVIAHRLSTIQRADKIIVLDKGQLIESGNHQELLSQDGSYKKLFDLQFKEG